MGCKLKSFTYYCKRFLDRVKRSNCLIQQGLAHAAHIAALMGRYLGWDADEIARQVNAYRQQVALTRKFDDAWEPQGQGRAHSAVKA